MAWDSVEIGLAGGEETVNFGPRNETGSSLYQVDTLASISPSEKVQGLPLIYSASSQDGFCMALSKQVLLFNSSCTVHHATLNFDSDVDRVALSHYSTFAAIGDRCGNLNFLHVATKQILFSQQLVQPLDNNGLIFLDITFTPPSNDNGTESLVILTSSGLLFEFSCLKLEEFQEAVNSQDFEQVKQLKQSIVTKCSSVEGGHDEVLTGLATLAHDGSNEFITYGKSSSLALWGTNPFDVKGGGDIVLLDKIESLMLGSEVIKACPTSDNNFLVVLDEQHMLSLWDISSLTMVAFWHFLAVDDFLLVSTSDVKTNTASSEEEHKIIILTKPANSQEKRFLQVYTLPTMKQTYSLQVSNTCFLAHITSNQETIYFTEAVQKFDDDNEDDTVTLRIRCLTEALPENRFYRLLHKHQFDAAEKFAKQFKLDTELVYKVKANTLLDKVSQWSSSQDHEDFDFEELKQCLSKIQEDDYVINCCLQAVFPTVEETYTILQYARERASKRDKSSGMICHPHLHNEILGVLNKLVTFENAYGIQQFSGSRWHSFQHADLLDEVKSCFGQGEVSSAVIIWRRHQSSFCKDFNAEKLESLFGSIGQHLQSSLIVPWLRDHLVPFVCKVLPDGVDLLASWLDQRARKMELSEKKGWPANALELVRVLPAPTYDSSAKKDSNTTSTKESGLARLAELVHGLSELQELHEKYSCRIGLAEYTEETTKTIVFRLLDGVKAAELLPQAMKKYIAPYITHYGLNKDQVLLEYIQEMFQKISSSCSFLSNSLWEPRVIAVISFIKDKQCYCQATLNVMIKACVPWSDAVTKLVNDAMVSYPNNLELKEQYRFVELKKVLRQYGVKSTQAPVAAKSKRIVRIILNRDEPTAVEDALKVVGAYHNLCESDVYVFRMQKLLQSDRGDECIDLLDSLPKDKASQYVQEIVTWLCCTLEEELPSELDCTQEHITAAQNAILLLKYIKKRGLHTYHDVDNLLQDLTKISLLQKEFSEFFSLDGYQCALKREELVQKYLKIYLQQAGKDAKDDKDEQQQKISFTKLVRLSLLAGITKEELMSRIARNALSVGDVNMALDICRDLLQHAPDPFISQALFSIIHAICKRISEGTMVTMDKNENTDKSNLAKDTHQLICQILNVCPPDLVCDCLEMCKLMSLANEVFAQCETGDYGFSVQSSLNSSRKDLLSEWSFGKRFKEDGLVLDSFIALPLAAKFCLACVPEVQPQNQLSFYQDRVAGSRISDQDGNECANANESLVATPSRLIQVSSAGLNTIRYLQENNLYKLALRYAFESIGICHQHFAANTLNVSELKNTNPVIASELEHLCKISKMGLEISQELIGGLLVKVFNHKVVDHDLGLGYICAIPKQLALDKMKSRTFFPGHNYGKLAAFSDVGVDFALLNNEPTVLETYQIIKNNALWGQKLSKMKIYVKDVYALDREEMMRLLPDLIQHKDINLELLLDFCRSFHLMEEEALLMYIKMQLLPPVSMDTCSHGDDITAPDYEVKVNTVAPMIPSEALVGLLVEVCGKIDAYDYDRIMFVLKLTKDNAPPDIVSLVEKGIQLLEYLYIYERRAPPSKYEKSFTYSRNPEDNSKMTVTTEKPLSEMSKKRLPFHPILYGDPWKVIADELSEETVAKLIGVAKLLKLSRDQMYLTAIQNLFKSPKSQQDFDSCDNTQLKPNLQSGDMLDRFDFEMARGLLYAVKNKEMAIAAAKWISQQLPLGEEKIKVLEACVDLANEWKTNCPADDVNKANKLYDRLKELSRGVATEHVLHKYNIAEPALVDLVTQPAKLICQLYENYGARDITTRNQPPDINKASDQIAAINNSSIAKIRLYLIEKWLPSRPVTDESRLDAMNQTQLDADEKSDDAINLKRVVYILQDSPPEHSAMFLLNFAYTEMSSTNISCRCRLRSLQALFAIFQDDVIEEVAKKNVVSIRQYMKSLTYMAEFEALHIQQSLNAFQKCNKEGLVRGLWRNHNHEKRGVRLIADLCLDNEIHDPQLWNSVLQQLLSFGMIRYLRHVLVCLAAVSDLWLIPCLPNVWRSVILAPFKNVSPPLSDDELKSCQESAMLLQRCPLLFDLDLIVVAQHFHRVGLHAYALACLVLVPVHDKQRQKIKELLDTKCAVVILDQLKKQCDEAKMLGHVKTLQEEVYQYIEDNQEYEVLLSTVHFDKMVAYLINTDQLEGLLMKTIKAKRLSNAQSLVHLYHQAHPGSPSGRFVSECNEKLSALDELMAFLESTQRLHEAMPYLPQPEDNNQSMKEDMDTMNEDENADLFIQ